jgi:soluble lytic murein transglycosylase
MKFRFFYAAPLAFSLMLGKICLASSSAAPIPPNSPSGNWKNELNVLRDAYAKPSARSLQILDRAHAANYGVLADHPLRIYAEYWRLSAQLSLGMQDKEQVRRFIGRNDTARLSEQLRREWLKQLGKARAWEDFSEQYVKFGGDDQEIVCFSWQERLERPDREALTEAKALWNSGRSAPEACDGPFGAAIAANLLANEEIWLRVRKLLEAGQAAEVKRANAYLPPAVRLNERLLSAAHNDSGRFLLNEKFNPKSRASVELTLHAIHRYSRKDAADAAGWLAGKGSTLPEDALKQAWVHVGVHGAMQHEPRAIDWFARAKGVQLNDTQSAWRARAALRVQDWKALQAAIDEMPAFEQREASWRYWLGRAHKEQGREGEAQRLWLPLSAENHFYGLLAAEEMGKLSPPAWDTGWKPQRADIDAVLAIPSMQRALLLYQAGMHNEGLLEWRWAMRGLDDKQLLAASHAATEAGVLDRSLNAAERTVALHDFAQRYPLPFRASLTPAVKQEQLDEAWVYGLIRQESAFISEVRSTAGAIGLMQLMPTTAKWVAKRVNIPNYHTGKLADIDTNLALGTHYLRHVLDDLADPVLATAAYNAGPGRARRWRAELPLEGAIYAETIPFNETRDYVKRVMSNAWFYSSRLGTPKKSLKEIMGTVPARGAKTISLAEGR